MNLLHITNSFTSTAVSWVFLPIWARKYQFNMEISRFTPIEGMEEGFHFRDAFSNHYSPHWVAMRVWAE